MKKSLKYFIAFAISIIISLCLLFFFTSSTHSEKRGTIFYDTSGPIENKITEIAYGWPLPTYTKNYVGGVVGIREKTNWENIILDFSAFFSVSFLSSVLILNFLELTFNKLNKLPRVAKKH